MCVWGGGNIHFYFSQKPSSRRMTFIGWVLNITWLPDGSALSEALSGLVLTCPDKSAVYPTLFLYLKYHFLSSYLMFPRLPLFSCRPPASPVSHAPFLPLNHDWLWCSSLCVCILCVYMDLLCGPLPRPLTSYAAWQVTNSFLIACTRKIISLFPFLGGTRQDVCAIIIASVPFPTSRLLFLEKVF